MKQMVVGHRITTSSANMTRLSKRKLDASSNSDSESTAPLSNNSRITRSGKRVSTAPTTLDESSESDDLFSDDDLTQTKTPKRKKRKIRAAKETPTHLIYKDSTHFSALVDQSPCNSSFDYAKQQLHPTARPEFLPCREEEFYEIQEHLESAIQAGQGSCICKILIIASGLLKDISGVPGTGKTATTQSVLKALLEKRDNEVIFIQCLRLGNSTV